MLCNTFELSEFGRFSISPYGGNCLKKHEPIKSQAIPWGEGPVGVGGLFSRYQFIFSSKLFLEGLHKSNKWIKRQLGSRKVTFICQNYMYLPAGMNEHQQNLWYLKEVLVFFITNIFWPKIMIFEIVLKARGVLWGKMDRDDRQKF